MIKRKARSMRKRRLVKEKAALLFNMLLTQCAARGIIVRIVRGVQLDLDKSSKYGAGMVVYRVFNMNEDNFACNTTRSVSVEKLYQYVFSDKDMYSASEKGQGIGSNLLWKAAVHLLWFLRKEKIAGENQSYEEIFEFARLYTDQYFDNLEE